MTGFFDAGVARQDVRRHRLARLDQQLGLISTEDLLELVLERMQTVVSTKVTLPLGCSGLTFDHIGEARCEVAIAQSGEG
ncbi:hypothetical protein [Sediminimonas sp.]|uniref:hypothetical protein n=1 Tax=Sediminimonas sp. TaxID=2823379 RepID=UPI0025ECCC78|nr:hypothetical protein [Sediminimonas sp.]